MKKIVLFGAGKSATVLIDYLLTNAEQENWLVTVVDADLKLAQSKVGTHKRGTAVSFDILDAAQRNKWIGEADIIISLLPPALHFAVAQSCVALSKNLLTASYVDAEIRSLQSEIENKNLLFLCEMGLDPGIDHMSAMKMIDQIRANKGKIISFRSHCGGLVAPESDDNPWHYKISWNSRSVVLAGKTGALYREGGMEKRVTYEELFSPDRLVEIPGLGLLSWYPNRDSLPYAALYGLQEANTFVRTTLRHPDFMSGWRTMIELKLTDETPQYKTDGKSLMEFFKEHMQQHGFGNWITKEVSAINQKDLLEDINNNKYVDAKQKADSPVAHKMPDANLTLKQLLYLGMKDPETLINKGHCSAADVMQLALEKKLALQPQDKDMIVMLHEIEWETDNRKSLNRSSLVVKGENNLRTAMAKTVGLPLGIAAKLILNRTLQLSGLHIPVKQEIYNPVLKELEAQGIIFHEEKIPAHAF